MFFTISWIIVKFLLIYVSYDPNKFTKATNSDMLNYGIWIRTEVSLITTLWFLLRASKKVLIKWTVNEKFIEIDQILKNEFSMNLRYKDYILYDNNPWYTIELKLFFFFTSIFRCATLSALSGAFFAMFLFGLTIYFLLDVPFDPFHKACVCFSIFVSNVSMYAITTEYVCYVSFVFMRFHSINNILRQLLFDDSYLQYSIIDASESKELIYTNYMPIEHKKKSFLNTNSNLSAIHMSEWMARRKKEQANHHEPSIKLRFASLRSLYTKMYECQNIF